MRITLTDHDGSGETYLVELVSESTCESIAWIERNHDAGWSVYRGNPHRQEGTSELQHVAADIDHCMSWVREHLVP